MTQPTREGLDSPSRRPLEWRHRNERERNSDEHLENRRPTPGRVGPVRRFAAAVSVAVGLLAGWGAGEGRAPSWDAYAGVRPEPTVLGLTATHIANLGLDAPADAR